MGSVIVIKKAVHTDQDEINHHAQNPNASHEVEDALWAQILVLEARIRVVSVDFFFTHARAPTPLWRRRRTAAAAESNSGCGRSMPATIRPSRRASADPPR